MVIISLDLIGNIDIFNYIIYIEFIELRYKGFYRSCQ